VTDAAPLPRVSYAMVEPASASSAPVLAELYERVLKPAFPPDELDEPWSSFDDAKLAAALPVLVARDERGEVLGGAVGEWYPDSEVVLLAYIAVRERARGLGIGGQMLASAVEAWRADTGTKLVLTEIEDPRFHRRRDGGDPVERVAFYARHGTCALDAPYFQPRLRPDARRVYHLMLSVLWADRTLVRADGRIAAVPVRAFLREYFAVSEGNESGTADEALRVLWDAYGRDELPMRPIGRYAELGEWHVTGCGHA
jgi:GNAT superfamily N-acetyltransferase